MGTRGSRAGAVVMAALIALWLAGCGGSPGTKKLQSGSEGGGDPFYVNGCDMNARPFGGGNGSPQTPYLLCAPEHLYQLNAQDIDDQVFNLAADITVPDDFNLPSVPEFTGTLDGKGYAVSGLKLPLIDVNAGGISNLRLTEGNVLTGYRGGLLAAYNKPTGRITACHASGVLQIGYTGGGLVGVNDGIVETSSAEVVLTGENRLGGLVGVNRGTIRRSSSRGAIVGDDRLVGGLVAEHTAGTITDCYSQADVKAAQRVGGLVALSSASITRSYANGFVDATDINTGGLVGSSSGTVTASYWDTQTSGQAASAAGTGKTSAELEQVATFVGWDFPSVWNLPATGGPPVLR